MPHIPWSRFCLFTREPFDHPFISSKTLQNSLFKVWLRAADSEIWMLRERADSTLPDTQVSSVSCHTMIWTGVLRIQYLQNKILCRMPLLKAQDGYRQRWQQVLNSKSAGSCGAERWTDCSMVDAYSWAELLHETSDSLDLTLPDSTLCFPVFSSPLRKFLLVKPHNFPGKLASGDKDPCHPKFSLETKSVTVDQETATVSLLVFPRQSAMASPCRPRRSLSIGVALQNSFKF